MRDRHSPEVPEPNRLAILVRDDPIFKVQGISRQRVGEDLRASGMFQETAEATRA